jgi:hypothetical protein
MQYISAGDRKRAKVCPTIVFHESVEVSQEACY